MLFNAISPFICFDKAQVRVPAMFERAEGISFMQARCTQIRVGSLLEGVGLLPEQAFGKPAAFDGFRYEKALACG